MIKSAKAFLAKRGAKIAAKAVAIRKKADLAAQKREKVVKEINKVTGADSGEYATNPIKASGNQLQKLVPDLASDSSSRGTSLGSANKSNMTWVIIAGVAALLLLPKLAGRRR